MISKDVTVNIPNGFGGRPVALLVQVASQYDSSVYIEYGDKRVNAKSIMGMMTLVLVAGDKVTVSADGSDEEAAADAVVTYLAGE